MCKCDRLTTEEFKVIAKKYVAKHSVSKQTARDCLIDQGIYTKDGKLHPNYGGEPEEKTEG